MGNERTTRGVTAFPASAGVHHHPASARRAHRERVALPDIDDMQLETATAAREQRTPHGDDDERARGDEPWCTTSRRGGADDNGRRSTSEKRTRQRWCDGPHRP